MEKKQGRRRKVLRFTAPRRAAFIEHLRRTGNWTAAAKAVGLHPRSADQRRRRDAEFALLCIRAKEEAARRLAGARDSSDGVADAEFETIRRGRGGRAQIVATRKGKWCRSTEDIVLAVLRQSGNVAAAARAAGLSEGTIWTRRREWPGFRARLEEALEEADVVLEFRLATWGNWPACADDGETGTQTAPGTNESPQVPFDPDLALRYLKWREQKRQGSGPRRGRQFLPRPRSPEEVKQSILRKLEAIARHDRRKKLDEGWSQDEEGRMIPPGWVRRDGGGGAGENGDSPRGENGDSPR